jgi:hypothetical protein
MQLYHIAVGPQQGRKVFTLQTLPDYQSDNPFSGSVGEVAGFSFPGSRLVAICFVELPQQSVGAGVRFS